MSLMPVGYLGMTHLGFCSALAAAARGFEVVGFDPDPGRTQALEAGRPPVSEPDVDELWARHRARLRFTSKPEALAHCQLLIVAPDVATNDAGESDLADVEALLETAKAHAGADATVVVLSQVPPGFMRQRLHGSGRLYYQVETLVFGIAMQRALEPERFIVGCAEPGQPLPEAYAKFLAAFGCPVLPMRFESAELAKIAINACLVSSVSTANTLAELCERIGARWSEIVPALRLDRRIGAHAYLEPGLGIAGGNLERDLATLRRLGGEVGSDMGVIAAFSVNSGHRRDWALRTLQAEVLSRMSDPRLAILGLAYKQDTASTKNSPSLALLRHLGAFRARVYDPVVPASVVPHPRMEGADSALAACDGAEAVLLMTPWREFRDLAPAALRKALAGRTVIDPYRVLDGAACVAVGLDYFTLGAPPARAAR